MGIIDTLSAGFDLVRKKLWLILLPVLLDIGLWLGPKLSIAALMRGLIGEATTQVAGKPEMAPNLKETGRALVEMAGGIDLSALLSSNYLGVPGLPATGTAGLFGLTRQVIEVNGGLPFLGLLAGLSLAGLLIGTVYLGLIAQEVRDGEADLGRLVRGLPRYWLRLIGVSLLVMVAMTFLGFPLFLMMSVFGLFSQGIASLLMGVAFFGTLWVMIYLAFVPQAILFGEDGVLQAVVHSISVVRTYFWSTLGLLVLVNVITAGLVFIWDWLVATSAGAIVAMAANAFVGTGLSAAILIFYRERLRAWQERAQQRRLA